MDHLKLTEEKLRVEEIVDLVVSPKCGAVSTFIGTTRDNFDGKDVVKLEYEAYETMGLKSLRSLCEEMRKMWPDVVNIAIYHRLGTVPVKEASIVIAISSPHRADAIKATEWCIESVKKSMPIWKKEVYADDGSEWKQNKELPRKEDKVEERVVPSHLILIRAPRSEIDQRIEHFIAKKRSEIDSANVRDFCRRREDQTTEFSCARIDSALVKRKDSKGHLQVNKVYNDYSRDQSSQDYMTKFIPKDSVEERLASLESQLSLLKSTPRSVYERLKSLEDRLLTLESISPEYVQFWDKVEFSQRSTKRKKVWSIDEIDGILRDLEAKVNSTK